MGHNCCRPVPACAQRHGATQAGRTLGQTGTEVGAVTARIAKEYPQQNVGGSPVVVRERRTRPDPSSPDSCRSSPRLHGSGGTRSADRLRQRANLMFLRAAVRRREMIPVQLWRLPLAIVRQLLAEVSCWRFPPARRVGARILGRQLAGALRSSATPVALVGADLGLRVFLFAAAMALLAGSLTGLMPALQASRVDLQTSLKQGGGASSGSSRHPFRSISWCRRSPFRCRADLRGSVPPKPSAGVSPFLVSAPTTC